MSRQNYKKFLIIGLFLLLVWVSYIKASMLLNFYLEIFKGNKILEYINIDYFIILGLFVTLIIEIVVIVNIESVLFDIFEMDYKKDVLYIAYIITNIVFVTISTLYIYINNVSNLFFESIFKMIIIIINLLIIYKYCFYKEADSKGKLKVLICICVLMIINALISVGILYAV
ncbi:MAG: hypothetical protein ACK5NF_00775 [Bacilli bacterium]